MMLSSQQLPKYIIIAAILFSALIFVLFSNSHNNAAPHSNTNTPAITTTTSSSSASSSSSSSASVLSVTFEERHSFATCLEKSAAVQPGEGYKRWISDDAYSWMFDYLSADSRVIDIGGFTGEIDQFLWDKFKPTIYVFEPITKYFNHLKTRFASAISLGKMQILQYAIGKTNERKAIRHAGDASSVVSLEAAAQLPAAEIEFIEVKTLDSFFAAIGNKQIDLLYINCEGCEYPVMEYLLEAKLHLRFNNLMIQFHYKDAEKIARRCRIRELLSLSHKNIIHYDFVWELWQLKSFIAPSAFATKLATKPTGWSDF